MGYFSCFLFLLLVIYCNSLTWINEQKPVQLHFGCGIDEIQVGNGESNVLIRKLKSIESVMNIKCFIENHGRSDKIAFKFCVKNDRVDCNKVNGETNYKKLNKGLVITYHMNKTSDIIGFIASIKIDEDKYDVSGQYYCEATSSIHKPVFRTSFVYIRDVYWWRKRYLDIPKEPIVQISRTKISKTTVPYKLECNIPYNKNAPSWVSLEFTSSIKWNVCEIPLQGSISMKMCMNKVNMDSKLAKDVMEKEDWTVHVYNQTLTILNIDNLSINKNVSFAFVCYTTLYDESKVALRYFFQEGNPDHIKRGIDVDATSKVTRDIVLIDPLSCNKSISFVRRNYMPEPSKQSHMLVNHNPSYIIPKYRSKTPASCEFYFNDKFITNNSLYQVTPHYLKFINQITPNMAGEYKFKVTSQSGAIIDGRFNVQVKSIPRLINDDCWQQTYYIDEGKSFIINCTFQPGSVNRMYMNVDLEELYKHDGVTGEYVDVSDNKVTLLSRLSYQKVKLKVNQLYYHLNDVKPNNDHVLTVVARNNIGFKRMQIAIFVVPKLRFYHRMSNNIRIYQHPKNSNCVNVCNRTETHRFNCNVKMHQYQNKNLKVDIYWDYKHTSSQIIQRIPQGSPKHFKLHHDSRVLMFNPVDMSKELLNQLMDTYLVCHVRVKGANYLYESSDNCSDVTNQLCSKISFLDNKTAWYNISSANVNVYWFLTMVVSIVVFFVVLILVIKCVQMSRGHTYKLDKLERQMGYDPEKEIQDEMFKPYDRDDYDPGADQLDDVSSKAPDLNSEDDIEIDITQFDEFVSMTRQYRTDQTQASEML